MAVERSPHAPLVGLGYLAAVLVVVILAVASYRKDLPWQHGVEVSVLASTAGLELNPHSEVKVKGVTVGEVTSITSDGRTATVHLRLDPATAHLVPAAADASFVPKTLFGEKYVNIITPPGPAGPPISAGGVIRQSATAVEVGELYTHLDAVLQALHPDQLSVALGSLAGALRGQGGRLGDTTATLASYLGGINPRLPELIRDVQRLDTTSSVYADAAPDLLRTLDNGATISKDLLTAHEDDLARLLVGGQDATDRVDDLVDRSGKPLLRAADQARPVLDLLADYASEFPCLIKALNTTNAAVDQLAGSRGPVFSAGVDGFASHAGYHAPADLPGNPSSTANNNTLPQVVPGWGPHCVVIPSQLVDVKRAAPFSLQVHPPIAPPGRKAGGR